MSDWEGFHYPAVGRPDILRELYLTSIGRISHPKSSEYPASGHPPEYQFNWGAGRVLGDFALLWIESGRGNLETAALGRMPLMPGSVLLLAPGEWHRYRPDPRTGWVERWICANGAYLHRLRVNGAFPSDSEIRRIPDRPSLDRAFDTLQLQSTRNCLWVVGLTLAVIAQALGETGQKPVIISTDPACGDALVDAIVHHIWTNCHRSLNVKSLAKHACVSRRMLERRFAASWPRTIAQEIALARVHRGKDLLMERSLTVKEAGYAAGFGGARRFILAHRRFFGTTPGVTRRQN